MKNSFNIIGKTILALVLGLSIAIIVVQHDDRFKTFAYAHVQQFFAQSYEGDLTGTVVDINLFSPRIVMKDLVIKPLEGKSGWQWTAQQGTLYFSWITFLLTGKMSINIELIGYEADSEFHNNQLAMSYHLERLFESPDTKIPAFLKSLQIKKGILRAYDPVNSIQAESHVHIDMKRINHQPRITFYITDGSLKYGNENYLQSIAGSIHVNVADINDETKFKTNVSCSAQVCKLDNMLCFVQGSWHYDHGQWSVNSSDNKFRIDPLTYDEHDTVGCIFTIPCSYISQLIPSFKQHNIDGISHGKINVKVPELTPLTGEITFDSCTYQGCSIDNATITAQSMQSGWKGLIDLNITSSTQLHGLWNATHKEFHVDLSNSTHIQIPGLNWNITPGACAVHATVSHDGSINASYKTAMKDEQANNLESIGQIKKKGESITASGTCTKMTDNNLMQQPKNYEIKISTAPFKLDYFTCKEGNTTISEFSMNDDLILEGSLNYAYIRSWLPEPLRQELNGEGFLSIRGCKEKSSVKGTLAMDKGVIKIPKLYNFIRSFNGNFDYNLDTKQCIIKDLQCNLNRGSISSKHMSFFLDDNYKPSFMQCPLVVDSCFVSWQKDLFAIISGFLLYKNNNGTQSVEADIIADKSQLKSNLFSTDLTKSILPLSLSSPISENTIPIDLAIHVMTKDPVQVKTSFLEAQAQMDVHIKNNIQQPAVSGSINVVSGELKFPYKSLSITGGSITLVPEQLDDPTIELTAKNKIKKHSVGLFVTGSLKSPHVHFEASPALTEEQIISLLLAGSQDSSLNLLMPTLVAQNINQVLFGPAQSDSKLTSYFSGLLNPLAYVRIVPRFTNESGRGGLRGAIEIGVTDKLTALIEKNFSLTEDTVFEVEYAISDELSVRGIKDEHGDLGGEMEMRWKF